MGTGSTLALLPAQNATGNFVKVVQRLPVRIDLVNYDHEKLPLFVGLSVEPSVDLRSSPTGVNAGKIPAGGIGVEGGIARRQAHPMSVGGRHVQPGAFPPTPATSAASDDQSRGSSRLAVVVPTFMEVLDTTIANVALRYIAGGLSAAITDSEWVLTSYLAANAIVLPISGYLASKLGRRRYFLLSIAVFTLSSVFCGLAGSLGAAHFLSGDCKAWRAEDSNRPARGFCSTLFRLKNRASPRRSSGWPL